jgi:chromate transporter
MEKTSEVKLDSVFSLFLNFLRLGCISFGGPLAHTAMFEDEFVKRRAWLSSEQFLAAISLTQLIPGPNSTELAMQIGYARHRWRGYILAGIGFILPAALLVAGMAELYRRYGTFGQVEHWLWGTKPAVAAIILVSVMRLTPKALTPLGILIPASFGLAARLLGAPDFTALMLAAAIQLLIKKRFAPASGLFLLAILPFALPHLGTADLPLTPWSLFEKMFLVGSMVFGSGYVLYSHFQSVFVEQLHWINGNTLAMAIAAGQLTPGPLFTSATFLGQFLFGPLGALLATIGIFSPAFLGGAIALKLEHWLKDRPAWRDCLQAWIAVCFLLLINEGFHMLPLLIPNLLAALIFGCCFVLLTRFRWNSALLVGLSALAGIFLA